MATPNFIYVGTGKAGSTWFHKILNSHPDVYVTPVKETNFFDLNYHRGISWYERFFRDAKDNQLIGEIAHRYLRKPEVASRIRSDLGDIKILAFFRNPADYFVSDYLFSVRNGDFDGTLDDWADERFDWSAIQYAQLLRPYFEKFSKDNIEVVCFCDIKERPNELLNRISIFLGIESFPHDSLQIGRVNVAKSPRNKLLSNIVSRTSKALKRKGGQRFIAYVKNNYIVQKTLYRKLTKKPQLSQQLKNRIISHSFKDAQWLDETFGTDFENLWCK